MTYNRILSGFLAICMATSLISCQEDGKDVAGSSTEGFFIQPTLAYNLTSDPAINVSVVRLGTSGDLTLNVTGSGASEFSVPSTVTIKDGERMGVLELGYNEADLQFNQTYSLRLSISNFTSVYGYGEADVVIEKPTAYYEYGKGVVYENWWAEQEDKTLMVREYANNVLQCYLPDCWGHDSGPGYDVQDYVFYWNTETNKVYVPFQYMGYKYVGDKGAVACKFGGPDHKEGSADWMKFIDNWYASSGEPQPNYSPGTKTFTLADSGDLSEDGVSGGKAKPDQLVLE